VLNFLFETFRNEVILYFSYGDLRVACCNILRQLSEVLGKYQINLVSFVIGPLVELMLVSFNTFLSFSFFLSFFLSLSLSLSLEDLVPRGTLTVLPITQRGIIKVAEPHIVSFEDFSVLRSPIHF
jgi:hypothetical protein